MKPDALKTKKIALNGILGALAVICLILASILPTNRISLYALSSFFVAVSIIESGVKAGWIFYVTTSLLALIIIPEKLGIIPYVVFFGMYGIVKYYIERLNKAVIEYVIKFIYFNICVMIAFFTVRELFSINVSTSLSWWILIILLEVIFFLYDFVYTLFINYYRSKLRKWIRGKS
jgi:hypothetical protein